MTEDKTQKIKNLLEKYRSNSLSEEEFQEFIQILGGGDALDIEEVDTQARKDWEGSKALLMDIQFHQKNVIRRRTIRRWVWRSAAAIVLLCTAWVFWPDPVPEDIVFHTDYGETRNIELPDGSRVLLNANTRLIWAGDWKERKQRSVELMGEAFFDVVRTDDLHFEVRTPHIRVDVLGTEFNVKSRGAETDVFLAEGKVQLEIPGQKYQEVEMVPGDFVQYDNQGKKFLTTSQNRIQEKASWVDGMLDFQNESVPEILQEFENLYGKSFRLENDEFLDKRMDLSLPYADWDLVRKALEIALDVEFTTINDTIVVK